MEKPISESNVSNAPENLLKPHPELERLEPLIGT